MIDLYFAPTPNGWKITIMLEECGLPYRVIPMDLAHGAQYQDDYLAISPNAKMPAIVDSDTAGEPLSLFESGAILMYLARKSGQFLPAEGEAEYYRVCEWLFWQVGHLGPFGGQASHFVNYAPEGNDYSKDRYLREYDRLLAVMNFRLKQSPYLAGDNYSIADIASFPWLLPYKHFGFDLHSYPHLRRWFDRLKARPALSRGANVGRDWEKPTGPIGSDTWKSIYAQGSDLYKNK